MALADRSPQRYRLPSLHTGGTLLALLVLLTVLTLLLAWPTSPTGSAVLIRPVCFVLLTWFFCRTRKASPALHFQPKCLVCGGCFLLWLGYAFVAAVHFSGADADYAAAAYLRITCEQGIWLLLCMALIACGLMLWVPEVLKSYHLFITDSNGQYGGLHRAQIGRGELDQRLAEADRLAMMGELDQGNSDGLRSRFAIDKRTAESRVIREGPVSSARHRYLIVVPVPFVPVAHGRVAMESAFAKHLKALLDSLAPTVQQIEVLAPVLPAGSDTAGMCVLDPCEDRISFLAAYPASIGHVAYCLALPGLIARVWRAVGRVRFVHAGPSTLYRPMENLALLFGWLRRRTTIYVADIDRRESSRMNYLTGQWSFGVYLRARYVHHKWASLQHHIARWICSMMLLKGRALVRDFGRGNSKVHYIIDSAYSREMILTPEGQAARWLRAGDESRPMRTCYFGRLVAYKGIDRMLQAVAAAREDGTDVTLDIYGGGDQEAELRSLTGSLGLQDAVRFRGVRTYGQEFFHELERYDLLLAAPLDQDTPRSALDAQALGMPILAFDIYYYKELAELGAGVCVVAWPDVAAMAKQMTRLFHDRPTLVALGQRGIAFATQNTQESWLERRAAWTWDVARP